MKEFAYLVCLLHLCQWENVINLDLQLARFQKIKQLISPEFVFLSFDQVAGQHRTGDLDTFRGKASVAY